MTLIALGYDKPANRLFCSADSRISDGLGTLTDFAPKILPLRLQYWKEISEGKQHHIRTEFQEFGFAYSGSSISAQSVYGWLTAALSQITVDYKLQEEQTLGLVPTAVSIASVGKLAAQTAQRIVFDSCFRRTGSISGSERKYEFCAYIFGFCRQEGRLLAVEIRPNKQSSQLAYECYGLDLLNKADGKSCCTAMGSGSAKFAEYFEAAQQRGEPINQNGIMAKILKEQPEKTVGGSFQGAFATDELFLLTPNLTIKNNTPCITLIGEDITHQRLDGYTINWASEHM